MISSIIERDYMRKYHQKRAHFNDQYQGIDSFLGENNNNNQVGSGCLEFDIILSKKVKLSII